MTRIQQSVEINVPAQVVYNQLTQFEDYPQFMHDVDYVQQLDDTHLHWVSRLSGQEAEWDAEITEQQPDRYIAWQNTGGPIAGGRVEVQPVGQETARVTLTLETNASSSASGADGDTAMTERLGQDLAQLKQFLETRGAETGAWRGEVRDAQPVHGDAGKASAPQRDASTQSDYALSRSSDDDAGDGRFSIAEEVSFDMQSDAARRVGHAPEQDSGAAEGMRKALKKEGQQDNRKT